MGYRYSRDPWDRVCSATVNLKKKKKRKFSLFLFIILTTITTIRIITFLVIVVCTTIFSSIYFLKFYAVLGVTPIM